MKSVIAWIRAHGIGIALSGLVLGGLALRVWGVSAVYQRIEDVPMARQIFAVYQGRWSPDPLLFYPMFFNYIVGVLLKIASALLTLLGRNTSPGLFEFTLDQVLLVARLVSAAMGALTIFVVFKIGKRLFSEKTALAAAFFFSLSFVHILYSHQIVLDVPMTLFYAIAFYFCVRILRDGRWPHYLLAAFFAGIAVATKYDAVFVTASIVMAHLWKDRETQKNIFRNLIHKKLLAAGFVSLMGFIVGHPYAFLWYKSFFQATKRLAQLVHATEWYLVLIKPQTLFERIGENKYFKGLGNVMSAEGIVFFGLIVLGLIWVLRRRTRETAFFAFSALAYFLGALGFLGFSRLRDLSTLALFYAFFAAFGLALLAGILGKGRRRRSAFPARAVLVVLVVLILGARTAGRIYYLAEDDTTQIAERWIRRNLPPGGIFGRELFTPVIADPAYQALFITRPYLIYSDFPAFDLFDYIETSSVQGGFFYQYAKYYPVQVGVYRKLNREHELLKTFRFRDIEYKNPKVGIYSGRAPRRVKQRLALPVAAPAQNPAREFVMEDGSPYGKDVNSFWLAGGERVERLFIGRTKIGRIGVFVREAAGDGTIVVRSGLGRSAVPVRKGADAFVLIEPARAFPYYDYFYKVGVSASAGLPPSFVKIVADDFEIGLEFFRSRDFVRAAEFFRKAESEWRPATYHAEISLYLAYCERMSGNAPAAEADRARFAADPAAPSRFEPFIRALAAGAAWERKFERYAGVDVGLFETTQSLIFENGLFARENAAVIESGTLADRTARKPSPGTDVGLFSALSPELRLVPQAYRAELDFNNPGAAGGKIGEADVVYRKDGLERTVVVPIELAKSEGGGLSKCVLPLKPESYGTTVRVRVRLNRGSKAVFDRLRIVPDLGSFLRERYDIFKDLLR